MLIFDLLARSLISKKMHHFCEYTNGRHLQSRVLSTLEIASLFRTIPLNIHQWKVLFVVRLRMLLMHLLPSLQLGRVYRIVKLRTVYERNHLQR